MSDRMVRGILRGENLLVLAATGTAVAHEARRRHGLAATSAQLLGQGLLAGGMLAALQKSERTRVNLQVDGDGPARGLFVDADTYGRVRGYVKSRTVAFPLTTRFAAQQALGTTGTLSVLRDVEGVFYRGTVPLEHRDLSRDLEHYFHTSEQLPTALQLEVLAQDGEELSWLGGVLLQQMPGTDDGALDRVRQRLSDDAVLQAALHGHRTPDALIAALFGNDALETREELELQYWCPCTRERVMRALQTLGPADLFDMIHKDGKAEVSCDFCGLQYVIDKAELQHVLDMVDLADAQEEAGLNKPSPAKKAGLLH